MKILLLLAHLAVTLQVATTGTFPLDESTETAAARTASAECASIAPSAGDPSDRACADPCHAGQCHVGHCSFLPSSPLAFRWPSPSPAPLLRPPPAFDSPDLEGPRRPPRSRA